MKPITAAAVIAILASQAHAFNHVWYWCGKSTTTCKNEGKPWNGVYPTYDCGHKLKWDNYNKLMESGIKVRMSGTTGKRKADSETAVMRPGRALATVIKSR
jgi:hypothetical protein